MNTERPFDPASIPKPGDQHNADVRAKQAEFQEAFGDFKARHVTGFWLGPAPQGEWLGMIFDLEDGSQVRAALPIWLFQAFGAEYVLQGAAHDPRARLRPVYRSRSGDVPALI